MEKSVRRVGRKNRAERRARVEARKRREDDGGWGEECRRCGWCHDASAPCLFEHESGSPEIESFVFGCRGEVYAHGLRDLNGVGAAREYMRGLLSKGPGTLLPCGACRAGEVFPVLFERGLLD